MTANIRYTFNPHTGELIAPISTALSPAEPFIAGQPNYLIPANSTDAVPPAESSGQKAIWNGSDWTLTEDHRGTIVYSTTDGMPVGVKTLGAIPSGYTATPCPSAIHSWNGSEWVLDDAKAKSDARMQRDARLAACDYTQLPDSPLDPVTKAKWVIYRQALRDYMNPWTVDKPWPVQPGVN